MASTDTEQSPLAIHSQQPGDSLNEFIEFPYRLYADDPTWVPPLYREVRDRLNPRRNPFFEHGRAIFLTAKRDGKVVGRCSAQVDFEHLKTHADQTGFFGLLDTIDDQAVCNELLSTAAAWLRKQEMTAMRGPISLSMNDESGVLVDGFDSPAAMLMPHSLPYQFKLIEQSGLQTAKELYAWRYEVGEFPERAVDAWTFVRKLPELSFRSVDKRKLERDIGFVHEILNDAWSDNWGFVPMTRSELNKLVSDLKLIIDPRIAFFVELDGRPIAMCVCLPNLNEVIADFNGKLGPTNIARLLWRTKVKTPRSARLIVLGIRQELRKLRRYGALSTAIYVEVAKRAAKAGYEWAELGWTLEDNHRINAGIQNMGARIYKRYRIYEKKIV